MLAAEAVTVMHKIGAHYELLLLVSGLIKRLVAIEIIIRSQPSGPSFDLL